MILTHNQPIDYQLCLGFLIEIANKFTEIVSNAMLN